MDIRCTDCFAQSLVAATHVFKLTGNRHAFNGQSYTQSVIFPPMPNSNSQRFARLALLLSFLAVFAALITPSLLLADELRTGKLGGICSAGKSTGGSDDNALDGYHCDTCGSLAFALPIFCLPATLVKPGKQLAGFDLSFALDARISGLPPNRGPPVL